MANPARRLPQNVGEGFFVDARCIDCDTCRALAPETFRDHGGQSSVHQQPTAPDAVRRARLALLACPTGSIGAPRGLAADVSASFPLALADDVYFCGYTSSASYGAWSYLVVRPDSAGGNVLVDSPRFAAPLVERIAQLGGVRTMFLTHRDDVADHEKFARRFGCVRVMHADDGAVQLGVERVLRGADEVDLGGGLRAIPTPGHTRGHAVLLYRDAFLFTGDHLAWSAQAQTLTAFRDVCWYSWAAQTASMARLRSHRFTSVLPGHGRIHHDDTPDAMREHLERCIAWMTRTP